MLYLQHFSLKRLPFQAAAPPARLFEHKAALEARARLQHLLRLRGIGLLTGEVGCGKTTACRQVLDGLPAGTHRACYVALTTGSVLDTYQAIAWELGLAPERTRAAAYRAIRAEISRLAGEARQLPVLVIDEAQYLRKEVLADLRLLTNFNMDSEQRMCLLLVGLTVLRRRLRMGTHESLAQRIAVRHHLGGLEPEELEPYLQHHLRLAGCESPLFEPEAAATLFEQSRGLPRQVNRIAHYALAAAAVDKAARVAPRHVLQAGAEVQP